MKNVIYEQDREPENLFNEDIEQDILALETDHSQGNILHLIKTLQTSLKSQKRLFIPVLDEYEDAESKDLFSLKKLDVSSMINNREIQVGIPRKVELFSGGLAYTAFTSRKELDKGQATKFTSANMQEFFEMALDSEDTVGIVINPWDVSVLLDKKLLTMILESSGKIRHKGTLYVDQGDLTEQKVDAIVNAANTALLPGSGVCGAIFAKAGKSLERACKKIGGCQPGEAVITKNYNMPSKYVIHTVGPVYSGADEDSALLANCYYNALNLAMENKIHSIAFPAISTGVYGFPMELAAPIAIAACSAWITDHPDYQLEINLICYDDEAYDIYSDYVLSGREDSMS